MIQLDAVSKHYPASGHPVRALDEVSLEIAAGEFVSVRGPSGCGKSTLLALVGGLALPTAGRLTVAGASLTDLTPSARAQFRADHIGFVFQLFHLLPFLNVLENVQVASRADQLTADNTRAGEILEQFGLAERLSHLPSQLSAGERQRVAMARALLTAPDLLLADEPTGNLDPDSAGIVLQLIEKFHSDGGTVLLVTHDERASACAERTIHLLDGRLAEAPISA
jgi:ABC-type lipoprotein export system ATPase subunit